MKSLFTSFVIATGMLLVAGARDASAQIENGLKFTTPFPFTAGNTTLPAGSYTVTVDDQDPQVLELQGGRTSVLFGTESAHPRQTPSKSEVVFQRYDGGYVLKNIWVGGDDTGYITTAALGERHIASRGGSPREHRVAARAIPASPKRVAAANAAKKTR